MEVAHRLEDMPEVVSYVKNQSLGFVIPYTIDGRQHSYLPDFIVRIDDGHTSENPLNVIVEVSGERRRDKEARVAAAKDLWVPSVNNHSGFGRWAFVEITDPGNVYATLRRAVSRLAEPGGRVDATT